MLRCRGTIEVMMAAPGTWTEGDDDVDPRVERSRRRVRAAALDELAEAGYGGFTIESVAARCGVARSTIYRHWPDRLTLIADALEALNRQPGPPVEPGGTNGGRPLVQALVRHLAEVFEQSLVSACLPALIDGAERHPEVRRLHHRYNAERRGALVAAIAAGVAAGEIADDIDPDLAATAIAGAIVYRRFMTSRPFAPAEAEALITMVLGPETDRRSSR